MARISQEEKEKIRQKILDVSKTFFYDVGYENTSTKMIAKKVGIAEGTIFNYFPTKTDILFESIYDNYFENVEEYQDLFNLEGNISEVVIDYLYKSMNVMLRIPRAILSEMTIQGFKLARKNPGRFKKFAELDFKYIMDLELYFKKLIERNILQDVDPKQLSELVYSAVMFEVIMYLYDKTIKKDILKQNIKTKIDVLIKGYLKGGKTNEY